MKKILLVVVAVLAAGGAFADERSSAVLERISAGLKAYGDYEVRFTASAESMDDFTGYYLVSGDRYRIDMQGEEHISDGVTRYEISHGYKEIIIDNADRGASNIFANPARAFEFAGDRFESRWLGSETILGRECDVIRLLPVGKAYGDMAVTLYVDSAGGLPVAVTYDYDGESVFIAISRIRKLDKADPALFVFDPAGYRGYEIIDFR